MRALKSAMQGILLVHGNFPLFLRASGRGQLFVYSPTTITSAACDYHDGRVARCIPHSAQEGSLLAASLCPAA